MNDGKKHAALLAWSVTLGGVWLWAPVARQDTPKEVQVPDIPRTLSDQPASGWVVFKVGRQKCRLDVTQERDNPNYFIAFADSTNGFETYGGGRFVWVDVEDKNGRVVLDFNKS